MAELNPIKLAMFDFVDVSFLCCFDQLSLGHVVFRHQAWVQVACPRLSIDWGGGFTKVLFVKIFIKFNAYTCSHYPAFLNVINSLC